MRFAQALDFSRGLLTFQLVSPLLLIVKILVK